MPNVFLKNKSALLFLIYIVGLILFAVFSYKVVFHDTLEYMSLAKKLAGFLNSDVYITHSLVYPFFLSLFVKHFPSILTMRLVNIGFIILVGVLLYHLELKKTAFLIWAFSPIVWMFTIIISPFVPLSFFLLVAYLSVKKWQENKRGLYLVISALAIGLAAAFHDIFLFLGLFFILSFFYDKKLKKAILFLLFAFLSFSLRLILDASLFSLTIKDKIIPFPFYSLIRFFGARLIIQLGLHPEAFALNFSFLNFESWGFLILISPLLFYLYKIDYQKNKNEVIFLTLSTFFFLIQGNYFYFIILTPVIIILLGNIFRKNELILHMVISFLIIFIMTYPYFITDKQEIEKRNFEINDLKTITKDFTFDSVIFDPKALTLFYIWDKNLPYIVRSEQRDRILQNNLYTTQYTFETKQKIDTDKVFELKTGLKVNIKEGIDYENLPWLLEKGKIPPEGYKLTKCYELLCVYEKTT